MSELERNPHHPPHWHQDDTWYALTACTFGRMPHLRAETRKEFARDKLKSLIVELKLQLAAWVILDDHYHLLLKLTDSRQLTTFTRRWHGSLSHEINRLDNVRDRRVWQNFWDTCIRNERDFWTRFNYIHHNPVKHGYVSDMNAYPFSSYRHYLRTQGDDWLADAFRHYPIRDFTDPND